MRISTDQMARFQSAAERTYKDSLLPHAEAYFPTVYDVCGPDGMAVCIDSAVGRARAAGFHGRASVRTWFDMAMLLGADFDADPLLAFLQPHLDWDAAREALKNRDPDRPEGIVGGGDEPDPIDMLDALHADAWDWIDRTAGDNYGNLYRALARLAALLGRDDVALPDDPAGLIKACARIFPEKAEAAEDAAMKAFLTAAAIRAAADGFAPGDGRSIYILRCFVGGIGAFHDPAYAVDGRTCADLPPEGQARIDAHRLFIIDYARRLIDAARRFGAEGV